VKHDIHFDGRALRSTSSAESFPWLVKVVTLVRVTPDGVVIQAKTDADKRAMLGAADKRDLLLAAWPGEWSQDVLIVDDLESARLSVGLPRKKATPSPPPQEAAASVSLQPYEPPGGLWRRLCELADLPPEGRRQIAGQVADGARNAAAALLARTDLDEGTRRLVLESMSTWTAAELADSEHCTDQDVAILADRFPDSARVLQAALRRAGCGEAVRERLAALSYMDAARLWMDSQAWGVGKRPELASAIVSVVLISEGDAPAGGSSRYERRDVIQSLAADLSPGQRLNLLRNPDYGERARHALLAAGALTDDELTECLPEITRRQHTAPTDVVPTLVQYVRRYPQLIQIAGARLAEAAAQLVADGWSPLQAARSAQWDALVTMARIAADPDLINALLTAAFFDRTDIHGHGLPWRDSRRYEFVELLLGKTVIKDSQICSALDRLTDSEIDDLSGSADKSSRLSRLCAQTLEARHTPPSPAALSRTSRPPDLPSDEELSLSADPQAVLLALLRDRRRDRTRVIGHVLDSAYMTDDLAWRLPVQVLENHPVYGPRLAARIAQICGDSSERWKVLASSWTQPTQLLASSLFKRLQQAATR
jgi:hypothetical protein